MRVIRKALGLLIVDIVIIIGIFVLQFRTDSSIIQKIANLQVTLALDENQEQKDALLNTLSVNYNGVNFHTDDSVSAKAILKGESVAKDVQLISYTKEDLQFTFNFTDNINVIFLLASSADDANLTVFADIPKTISDFYLPYNLAYNMKILKEEKNKILLNNKKLTWNFSADEIVDGYVHFTYSDNIAHYSIYDDTKKFTFDSITELAAADTEFYQQTISNFNENLITSFKTALADNSFTEQAVVAYIATMAQRGAYQQAIDEIPQAYKKSETRTYLSAPYLNNLAAMDVKLDESIKNYANLIAKAAETGSIDIFATDGLAVNLCLYPDSSIVTKVLENALSVDIESSAISQVTGIIKTYVELLDYHEQYAQILSPIMPKCLDKIASACSYENDILTISENDTFLSVVQGVETASAILRYGEATQNSTYIKAGRVLVNSYISECSSFDLRTLSNIYPLIEYDNWYYPHLQLLNSVGKNACWTWTCAKDVKYSIDSENALNLEIDFPQGLTHYVIFKGIPAFSKIFIYNISFRTDPRFETYNSSGYVYKSDTKTLLLKSRHKSQLETVRMIPTASTATTATTTAKPAQPATTAATATSSTAAATTTASTNTTSDKPSSSTSTSTNTTSAATPPVANNTTTTTTTATTEESSTKTDSSETSAESSSNTTTSPVQGRALTPAEIEKMRTQGHL